MPRRAPATASGRRRAKNGAVSFDVLATEAAHAPVRESIAALAAALAKAQSELSNP